MKNYAALDTFDELLDEIDNIKDGSAVLIDKQHLHILGREIQHINGEDRTAVAARIKDFYFSITFNKDGLKHILPHNIFFNNIDVAKKYISNLLKSE